MHKETKQLIFIFTLVICIMSQHAYKVNMFCHENMDFAKKVFIESNVDPDKYLPGINFMKPVVTYEIHKGDIFIQYQTPGSPQGNFYALDGATPSELGISDVGYDPVLKQVVKKEKRTYVAIIDCYGMSSFAAPVMDNWSTPEVETQTRGSKKQIFTTCKQCFE